MAKTQPQNDENRWQKMLDDLPSGQGGPFFFLQQGKTKIKIVPVEGTEDFFAESRAIFQGKEKTKYVMLGLVAGATGREIPQEDINRVQPIIIPKTVLRNILTLLAEGYDLLSADEGHGITIVKSGEGKNTTYSVLPSPKPVQTSTALNYPDESLEELANMFYTQNVERAESGPTAGSDDEDEAPRPKSGKKKSGGGGGGDW